MVFSACDLPIWKTVILGLKQSPCAYHAALLEEKIQIPVWTQDVWEKVPVSPVPIALDLFRTSVADLGFRRGAKCGEISAMTLQSGFELCPAETSFVLRTGYKDQPAGESLRLVMETLSDSDGDEVIFIVGHGNNRKFLHVSYGSPDHFLGPREELVLSKLSQLH